MFDPWVHASNLLKSSKNSWQLTGHGWHSFGDIGNLFDPWVHASNLLKPRENSWELTQLGGRASMVPGTYLNHGFMLVIC